MTFEEALAELGIDADAGPDQARRAYLRLLKTRKPETDPQGFMRLREAYDLAKQRAEWRDTFMRARAAEAPQEPAPAAPEPIAVPDPIMVPAPVDDAPHEEEEPAPPSREEPRSPAPPREEPVAEESHEEDEHEEEETHEEEPHEEEPLAPPNAASIDALLARGLHEEAAAELARLFDEAVERSHDATPAVGKALRLILMLFARSNAPAAAALGASLFDYLRVSGQEARAIRGADAARWTILRELAALSPSFPDAVRSVVARAAMVGDLGQARTELAALQARRPGPAAEAAILLRRRAPVIAAAVADTLDPPAQETRGRPTPASGGRSTWAYGAVAIGIFRLLMMLSRSSSSTPSYEPSRSTPSYDPAGIAAILDAGTLFPVGSTRSAELRRRALDHAASVKAHADYALGGDAGARRALYDAMSTNAAEIERALAETSCFEARLTAQATSMLFEPHGALATDDLGRGEAGALLQAVNAYCNALEAGGDGGAKKP